MNASETNRRGFTLIEMLAAMAVLVIISLFVARLFSDSTRLWKLGNRRVVQAMDGRAVIDFMVRELSSTIADDRLVLAHYFNIDSNILGMNSDRIYFVATDQIAFRDSGYSPDRIFRQAKQVSYHIKPMRDLNNQDMPNRYRIVRSGIENAESALYTCYTDPDWWQQPQMSDLSAAATLAENVRTLEFWLYDRDGNLILTSDPSYQGNIYRSNLAARRLGFIEIYIEMLGEDDAIKASLLSGQAAIDFADRASRRYVGRVYMNHGLGYGPDA